ncbi:uncharacterized protein LOC112691988 isoform X2 [Sipha flava]|uniref:Uncharacterized protein LOC112691988 isoform X2 n=1 Tax=Sipha flava TaxID=143950 RepID=A0A8B8GHA0_9HEMI|nr:uncharacterized protein LOC112691988 isoform X2 [Sipha flava]
MMEDIQTWWEVPSIVHFCKMFNDICNGIFPIDINEFEQAIEDNSILLEDMTIRFIKICGCRDINSKKWWKYMKNLFQTKCVKYSFEYSLDSVTYFDELTRKQKVDTLYILCHIILDVKSIQSKMYHKREIWKELNVKPLGYDLKNSVYWYFGSTRLYKEDFENTFDLSANIPILQGVHKSFHTRPYPSGIVGPGKWNMICDDNYSSWYSLANNTECSTNDNIRSLHQSVCEIINKLPNIKKKRLSYKYLIKQPKSQLKNIQTRSLRPLFKVNYDENSDIINEQDIHFKRSKIINDCSIISQLPKTRRNTDFSEHIKRLNNRTSMRLQLKNVNTIMNLNANETNINESKVNQNDFEHEDQVTIEHHGQENTPNVNKFNTKLKTWHHVRNSVRLDGSKISSLSW